jgi:hypothetical protein
MKGISMFCERVISAFGLLLSCTFAFAQSETIERNATAEEIQGEWQLLLLPDALQLKLLPANPWPSECQFYSYDRNGNLKSIEKLKAPCDVMSAAQLRDTMTHVPAVVSWKYELSPAYHKGVILVSRSDVSGYSELWEPHIVAKAFSKDGVEFREGDLILYLADMKAHQLVWIRHLRKLT